jgi:hypothetical protein
MIGSLIHMQDPTLGDAILVISFFCLLSNVAFSACALSSLYRRTVGAFALLRC